MYTLYFFFNDMISELDCNKDICTFNIVIAFFVSYS